MNILLLSSILTQGALLQTSVYRSPNPSALLILVSGFNQDGNGMLTESWKRFADKEHLILLAPSFHTEAEEVHQRRGYYYPELGSGEELEAAISKIEAQEGRKFEKIYLFGFSAGAHFSHRFALWKPERVAAFVAYSAGWWDKPTSKLKGVPALIMCGEADLRYPATKEFFDAGQALGCRWVWRSYTGVGHELTPQVEHMAQAFLAHYIEQDRKHAASESFIGDAQTYHVYPLSELEKVPPNLRVVLPSKAVADEWGKEN